MTEAYRRERWQPRGPVSRKICTKPLPAHAEVLTRKVQPLGRWKCSER